MAGRPRRQGAAVSRSLFGFILGPLQLEDARVSPIGDLGQNQQVVAPEALRRLPLTLRVAVDPGEGDVVAGLCLQRRSAKSRP